MRLLDDWVPMNEPHQRIEHQQNETEKKENKTSLPPIITSTIEHFQENKTIEEESYRISTLDKRPTFHVIDVSNFDLEEVPPSVEKSKFKMAPQLRETYRVSDSFERPKFHKMNSQVLNFVSPVYHFSTNGDYCCEEGWV